MKNSLSLYLAFSKTTSSSSSLSWAGAPPTAPNSISSTSSMKPGFDADVADSNTDVLSVDMSWVELESAIWAARAGRRMEASERRGRGDEVDDGEKVEVLEVFSPPKSRP